MRKNRVNERDDLCVEDVRQMCRTARLSQKLDVSAVVLEVSKAIDALGRENIFHPFQDGEIISRLEPIK